MKIKVFASGSSGNCTLVQNGDTNIIIDMGISSRSLCAYLKNEGLNPQDITGILITHAHGDHISGLSVFEKKYNIPVFASENTASAIDFEFDNYYKKHDFFIEWSYISSNNIFSIGNLLITSFNIPHDSNGALGYIIKNEKAKFGYLTDAGFLPDNSYNYLNACDALVLEMNHDLNMLRECEKYSESVKFRISSKLGHLSNEQAAEILEKIDTSKLRFLLPAHISENSNTFEAVTLALNKMKKDITFEIIPTYQKECSKSIEI